MLRADWSSLASAASATRGRGRARAGQKQEVIFAFWSQWGGLGRMAPGWLSLKLFMTLRLVTALRATAGVERRSDKEQAQ